VITDRAVLETIDDFRYSRATDNRWHLAALTYDGRNSPLPALQYFIDGVEMVGNSQLENGSNSIINYTWMYSNGLLLFDKEVLGRGDGRVH